jgi:hypothetical protein
MKRLVAITMRVALAGLAGAAISLIPIKALADTNIRLAEQSCEVQADEQNLTGAEKDSFIFKCQSGIDRPSAMPITTGGLLGGVQDRGDHLGTIAESYEFCDSGITPVGVKLTPQGMPITTGGKLGGVQERGYRVD